MTEVTFAVLDVVAEPYAVTPVLTARIGIEADGNEAVHAIALRNDPTLENDVMQLFDDKNQAVRVRAAAAYLRLEWIKSTARPPAPRPRVQKPRA